MKNFKLRWFDECSGEMIFTETIQKELEHFFQMVDGKLTLFVEGHDCDVMGLQYDPINSEPMVFTGRKDRDGQDVYEGDILTTTDIAPEEEFDVIGKVVYCEDTGCFRVNDDFGESDILGDWFDFKIVGNIYQNPDLIKTKEVADNG